MLPADSSAVARESTNQLPAAIVRAWKSCVEADMAADPLTALERTQFVAQYGASSWNAMTANPLTAYGATLLIAVATKTFLLVAQIGDGDIVTVSSRGCPTRPFPADVRHFAGETTSLCLPIADQCFSVQVCPLRGERPALVLLSTDGYSNSYERDEDFLRVGADLFTILKEEGIEPVESQLTKWLEEVSRDGSGDDVTLGILSLL